MFGTLVEVEGEGGNERRWGRLLSRRRLRGYGGDQEYDEEDPVGDVQHGNLRGFREYDEEEDLVGDAMRANLRGFRLGRFGDENPTWVFDDNGNVTMDSAPAASSASTFDTVADLLKTVAPSLLGVVTAAINRGAQPNAGNSCPAGYAYYSPIVKRCFQTPQEMSTAEQLFLQAGGQAGGSGGGMNTALMVGAGVLGLGALLFFMKR